MKQYHDLLQDVLDNGEDYSDRTGVGVRSVFGRQSRYDLTQGFPLLTTKKTHMKSIVHELLWFLKGDTNVKYLQDNGVRIWNEWADEDGDLGPVYGKQWVSWRGKVIKAQPEFTGKTADKLTGHVDLEYEEHNQIKTLVDQLKNNPSSRRLLVSAWNVSEIEKMALAPCHLLFQFKIYRDELSCQLYQRSADLFLGVPFNIASYSLLTHMLAQCTGLKAKEFVHTIGDAHIYHNHFDQTKELLSRDPDKYALPQLELNKEVTDIFDFKYGDINIVSYESYPTIKAQVAV